MGLKAPFYKYDDIRRKAELFLAEHNPSGEIPVPIERIVEIHFEMDIVPEPGLHQHFDIDSYISCDLTEIRVDDFVYQSRPGRYRFSLCHELGHRVLHQDVYASLDFSTISEWKDMMKNAIPEREYRFLEWQANSFAGLVLVDRETLSAKYEEACRMVQEHGMSPNEDSEVFRDAVAEFVAGHFVVSPAVVTRRLECDGVWEKC